LLPFSAIVDWGAGLPSADAGSRPGLRERLWRLFERPELAEAVFIASPSLFDTLDTWRREPDSERGQRAEHAWVRYFMRMAGRPTPFGLFAGCGTGRVGQRTLLSLPPLSGYRRHTRLDMGYLASLADALAAEPALRRTLRFRPSSGLYRAAGRVRYPEARADKTGRDRSYRLTAVEDGGPLSLTLDRARGGATLDTLAAALCSDDPAVTSEEAAEFVSDLAAGQLLVPELAPRITGPEPTLGLAAELGPHPAAAVLRECHDALATADAGGLGQATEVYREIARKIRTLPARAGLDRLFQVDIVLPGDGLVLGERVVEEIARAVELLHRVAPHHQNADLKRFRERFRARYEQREVRLCEALDEEAGIGFEESAPGEGEPSPLLDGLEFPARESDAQVPWGARERHLLRRLATSLAEGGREIILDADDEEALSSTGPPSLPATFAATVALAAASAGDIDRGAFRLEIVGAAGPSGANLLGRFCHADPALAARVADLLAAEEADRPDALYAEIVHLPEGRVGNLLLRPVLRRHEIPYLGASGAPEDRQVPVTDLWVSVHGERIVLRSRRLGCEVLPRLTTAHNFRRTSLPVYRFLCALQGQGVARGLRWSWGPLDGAPFLPRVTHGRVVLAPARWRLRRTELAALDRPSPEERLSAALALRRRLNLPRFVALEDGDHQLPVDLDNALSIDAFVDLVRKRDQAVLLELTPSPDEHCVVGPTGRFRCELVVPFIRRPAITVAAPARAPDDAIARSLLPGSEWLYAKVYCGTATADAVLREIAAPLRGLAREWFFIRYGDPEWHVRLRFHGEPGAPTAELLSGLHRLCEPLLADGRVWRVALDTYERELERYGGSAGMALCETLFFHDSEAVLAIVEALDGEDASEARAKLALRGLDLWLDDLGLPLTGKLEVARGLRDAYLREHDAGPRLRRQLGDKFRAVRSEVGSLLAPEWPADHWLAPGFTILAERSARVRPTVAALSRRLPDGVAGLAPSLLHMHANRVLRTAGRKQELVLYDTLTRIYESEAARRRERAGPVDHLQLTAASKEIP